MDNDLQRVEMLLANAKREFNKAVDQLNQTQEDSVKERTGYFEKLTIGSGAAIAAIVSFLGAHSIGANAVPLKPEWVLRTSLVSLVVAMVAGLYRNFRYPYYLLQVRKVVWIEAALQNERCKLSYLSVNPNLIKMETGEFADVDAYSTTLRGKVLDLENSAEKSAKDRERMLTEWTTAEKITLVGIGIAMVSLGNLRTSHISTPCLNKIGGRRRTRCAR